MLDEDALERGRQTFEDVLRQTAYAPTETVVIAGQMQGPDGEPVICGYWRVFTNGTFERVSEAEATAE